MLVCGLLSGLLPNVWAATCLAPHEGFDPWNVWHAGFNSNGGIVGPNGEVPGSGNGSGGGDPSSPNGGSTGGGGPTPTPGGGSGNGVGGSAGDDGPTPTPGGGIVGPGGEIVGPNGEVIHSGGGTASDNPTPSQPGTGLTPSGGPTSPTGGGGGIVGPGGEVVGPNGEIIGPDGQVIHPGVGTGSGGGPSPSNPTQPTPGGTPSNPNPPSTGGSEVPVASPSPTNLWGNHVLRVGPDNVLGPVPGVRPLEDPAWEITRSQFDLTREAPSFQGRASTRQPGDPRPMPSGQHTAFRQSFSDGNESVSGLASTTRGAGEVRAETRMVSGRSVSGLRIGRTTGGAERGEASVRTTQRFRTPKQGTGSTTVQWTIGDEKHFYGEAPHDEEFVHQVSLGIASASSNEGGGSLHFCSNDRAMIGITLAYTDRLPDVSLLTVAGKAAGTDELTIPFAAYVDLGDFDQQFGNAGLAMELTTTGVNVTLNGEGIMIRPFTYDELGLSGAEALGESFEVYAASLSEAGLPGSFVLEDLLVFQATPVPEPSAFLLILGGGLALTMRRKRRSADE